MSLVISNIKTKRRIKQTRRCKNPDCNNLIRTKNKTGFCSACYIRIKTKDYEKNRRKGY